MNYSGLPQMNIEPISICEEAEGPYSVAVAADGSVWVTLIHAGAIVQVNAGGIVRRFELDSPGARPAIIVAGLDDVIWFTRMGDHKIGRIGPDGSRDDFSLPSESTPYGIAVGPDGSLWFTEMSADRIGRIGPAGEYTSVALPVTGGYPSFIVEGPDHSMWFTLNQSNAIGRIDAAGIVALYDVPTAGAGPVGICRAGSAVAFVEIGAGQVGWIDDDGNISETPLSDRESRPHAVTSAPDGSLWLTEWGANRIARVAPSGMIMEWDVPAPGKEPHGIAVAPSGEVWVALENGYLALASPE